MNVIGKFAKAIKHPHRILPFLKRRFIRYVIRINNRFIDLKSHKAPPASGSRELDEIRKRARVRTDVSDHLVTLFAEAVVGKPSLIVELGVRGGESTFVLEQVAKLHNSKLICVDIEDCSSACTYENSMFIRGDDIEFAKRFEGWCNEQRIKPEIDVLVIDTSHLFEHTLQEIEHWFPLLSGKAKVFFHDTNLKEVYRRKDGTMGTAWDNDRGVIRALETYFNESFEENEDFIDIRDGWLIKHHALCNGFTILERIRLREGNQPTPP